MPLSRQKLSQVMKKKVEEIPERHENYHDQLIDTLSKIVTDEKQHRIRAKNIQKDVDESCSKLGEWLNSKKNDLD